MNKLMSAILGLALLQPAATASAQNIEEIRERARFLEEYKSLIRPEAEKSLRLAAIEEGLKSGDSLVRREAFDAALGSDDADLVFLGLKALFKQRSQLTMELSLPEEPTDHQQRVYERFATTTFSRLDVLENDEISFEGNHRGAFIAKGFVLTNGNCHLKITSVSAELLSGTYGCAAGSSMPARIAID